MNARAADLVENNARAADLVENIKFFLLSFLFIIKN